MLPKETAMATIAPLLRLLSDELADVSLSELTLPVGARV